MSDIASEAACWAHVDSATRRLVLTRGAAPHDKISCPVGWLPEILRKDPVAFAEEILGVELTDAQKEILRGPWGWDRETPPILNKVQVIE